MKNLVLLITTFLFSTSVCCQDDFLRIGQGNGTFVPDITFTTKMLQRSTTKDGLEKLFPKFEVRDSSANREYNKRTDKFDSIASYSVYYKFTYAEKYVTSVEAVFSLNGKVGELKFNFDIMPTFFKRQQQLTANGYHYNEYSSKVATKLNYGNRLEYYDAGKLCVILDNSLTRFHIFRTLK